MLGEAVLTQDSLQLVHDTGTPAECRRVPDACLAGQCTTTGQRATAPSAEVMGIGQEVLCLEWVHPF